MDFPYRPYTRQLAYLIGISSVLHLFLAYSLPLGNDEVYYWTYALHPSWSYFDHPPLVGWSIWLTTLGIALHQELWVRLSAIIYSAISTYVVFDTGRMLRNLHTGWIAALLFQCMLYSSIIAGVFILPDSPQLLFWWLALRSLLKLSNHIDHPQKEWLWFGLWAGLATFSKIHGLFLWLGAGLYVLLFQRQYLKQIQFYLAGLISLLFLIPILLWNIQHHFITYSYHSQRVSLLHAGLHPIDFFTELIGEFVYQNPFIYVLIWWCLIKIFRGKYTALKNTQLRMLLCSSLPLISVLLVVSWFHRILPHWSGPAYSSLVLIAAAYLDERMTSRLHIPSILKWAIGYFIVVIIVGWWSILFYPGTLGSRDPMQYGSGDFTLDMYGWRQIHRPFQQIYETDIRERRMQEGAFIISNKWFPLAHEQFYVAWYTHQPVQGIGAADDLHEYAINPPQHRQLQAGDDAYCIVPSNYFIDVMSTYGKSFEHIDDPVIILQYRNNQLARKFFVYRLHHYLPPR
ncbi:MAG: glycosyltransferase family 39 protein [Thermoflavifilum sp.]|nr:glycosyltransferase family 39 protein [Thermoflavifilum sp.]